MSQLPLTLSAEEPVPTNGTVYIICVLLETYELLIEDKEIKLPK